MHIADRRHKANGILAALPDEELARIRSRFERVELPLGSVIHEPNAPLKYVYFPLSGIISLLNLMEDGSCGEISVIGNEGVESVVLFMGGERSPNRGVVQGELTAIRLPARVVKEEFARGGALQRLLLRYTQALMVQMGQTVVCNRHHTVDKQLCRWLLLSFDRMGSDHLVMTQELIANMLGVRREGVTCAARKLQEAGLIKYSRGHITLLDRDGMEERACECYRVVRQEYDRLLGAYC